MRDTKSILIFVMAHCAGLGSATSSTGYGVVKRFTLVIGETYVPDLIHGHSPKLLFTANGTAPGPAIVANEGDWVVVTVINRLPNVTSLHWHGMLMVGTSYSDGVPGVSQCSIQPHNTMTYSFRASTPGTYWYHGHVLTQYPDGLYGPLIIRPFHPWPVLAGVTDDWTLSIADWYRNSAYGLVHSYYLTPASDGNEPIPDAIVGNGNFSGALHKAVRRGSTSRIRFIGAGTLSMFAVSIDGVTMRVIEVDATPVLPYEVDHFSLNPGQRVSVLVDWGQVPRNTQAVWLRVTAMADMYATNISGYVPPYEAHVHGAQPLNPYWVCSLQFSPLADGFVSPAYGPTLGAPGQPPTPAPAHPDPDNNLLDARPVTPLVFPPISHTLTLVIAFWTKPNGVNVAGFNGVTLTHVHSTQPAVMVLMQPGLFGIPEHDAVLAGRVATYPLDGATVNRSGPVLPGIRYNSQGQYLLPYGAVVEITIYNTDEGEHPIHTHGHGYWVIATSDNPGAEGYVGNYIVRDTISIPAGGWAKIVTVADNPGVWTWHCHIDWHIEAGLLAVMIEAPERLLHLPIPATDLAMCGIASGVPQILAGVASPSPAAHHAAAAVDWFPSYARSVPVLHAAVLGGCLSVFAVVAVAATLLALRRQQARRTAGLVYKLAAVNEPTTSEAVA